MPGLTRIPLHLKHTQRFALSLIVLSVLGLTSCATIKPNTHQPTQLLSNIKQPNVVLIVTDDQRWDTLWAMPNVQKQLVKKGVNFINAFVTTPQCCPFRASLLSGGFYPQHTGVLTNNYPNGSAIKFNDKTTLATLFQDTGYRTAFLGKYMSAYLKLKPFPYVPPGWSKWIHANPDRDWNQYEVVIGSSERQSQTGKIFQQNQYITDFLKDEALSFLGEIGDNPFFLYFAPKAIHRPAIPAPQDKESFVNYSYRDRAFKEEDLTDKPTIIQRFAQDNDADKDDPIYRNQLQSLQAIDRAIGAIVKKIKQMGKLQQTIFIYTSDNGYLWGEHGLWNKGWAYEESIRVPLIMVVPGTAPQTDAHLVVANLDIGPTLFEFVGIDYPSDRVSLAPLLSQKNNVNWRDHILIQEFRQKRGIWAGLRTLDENESWKYVEWFYGEKELYNLTNDPFEMKNLSADSKYRSIIDQLSLKLQNLRSLTIIGSNFLQPRINMPYQFQIEAVGGTPPYQWEIFEGHFPEGLKLDRNTGVISGKAVKQETNSVSIKVTDSKIVYPAAQPQSHILNFIVTSE